MSSDMLKKISEENIPKMLEALQQDWPMHFLLYQIVNVMREYKKAGSPWLHAVYLHGNYNSGVYLHHVQTLVPKISEFFYVYTLVSDLTLLQECLKNTEVIPWQKGEFIFVIVDSRFTSAIEDVFAFKNVLCNNEKNTIFWYPSQKEIQSKQLPEDVCLEFLDESYAEEMNRTWRFKSQNSELIHAENIRRNFAIGLFRKSDKRLLSSALSTYTGGIFVLHTDPEFRGRGYAVLVIEGMTREIRRRDRIPFCTIVASNKSSETAFTKSGYEVWSKADYIYPETN